MPDFPRHKAPATPPLSWLLQDASVHPDEMDWTGSVGIHPSGPARAARKALPGANPQMLIDRLQDVARTLTDDFVSGRTEMRFNTFCGRSRILWRRVAKLRRSKRADLLS